MRSENYSVIQMLRKKSGGEGGIRTPKYLRRGTARNWHSHTPMLLESTPALVFFGRVRSERVVGPSIPFAKGVHVGRPFKEILKRRARLIVASFNKC